MALRKRHHHFSGGRMKKNIIAVSAVALFLLVLIGTSAKRANYQGLGSNKKVDPVEIEEVTEQNIRGEWQSLSMPYLYNSGWNIAADFIYWRADEDGLEYGKSGGKLHRPDTAWSPGFKFGVGYTFGNQDFWDVFLRWTFFQTHQHGHEHGSLHPWWSPTLLGPKAKHASSKWRLHYNTLDLELGRDYFISKSIALRPHLGLRGALIWQHYDAKYKGVFAEGTFLTNIKAKNNFGGVGVRAGAQLFWHFTEDWSVIGSLAGALLYGHFNIDQDLKGVVGGGHSHKDINQELSRVAPNLEASLGFQWETFFSEDRYRVAVSLAYEFTEWFSQNQMSRQELIDGNGQVGVTHFDRNNGDLGLQGATLEVRFDF